MDAPFAQLVVQIVRGLEAQRLRGFVLLPNRQKLLASPDLETLD